MLKKRSVLFVLGAVLLGSSVFGVSLVGAQDTNNSYNTIVQKISQKFNLNQNEVQAVFDEAHQERHLKMRANLEERLNQAVKDGKINESQKQAILDKFSQIKDKRSGDFDKFKTISEEQRRALMEQTRTELETWASQNGISLQTLKELIGHHGHFRMRSR